MGETRLERRAPDEPLSTKLLYEVAEQTDIDPVDISPPLSTVIDTDALEALFSGGSGGFSRVEFTYVGHRVTVQGEEIVQIRVE